MSQLWAAGPTAQSLSSASSSHEFCVCTFLLADVPRMESESDSWSTAGSRLTQTPTDVTGGDSDYCVAGSSLKIGFPGSRGMGLMNDHGMSSTLFLQKQ